MTHWCDHRESSHSTHTGFLFFKEREKKNSFTHTHAKACVCDDRQTVDQYVADEPIETLEGACGQFFFILHPGWDDCQSGQSPAEQVISKYTHTVTRTHTNTCTHNRQMLSGLNLLPHPDLLVHFGGGRPNSSKTLVLNRRCNPQFGWRTPRNQTQKETFSVEPHVATECRGKTN